MGVMVDLALIVKILAIRIRSVECGVHDIYCNEAAALYDCSDLFARVFITKLLYRSSTNCKISNQRLRNLQSLVLIRLLDIINLAHSF